MMIGAKIYTVEWYDEYNLNIIFTFSNLHFVKVQL